MLWRNYGFKQNMSGMSGKNDAASGVRWSLLAVPEVREEVVAE